MASANAPKKKINLSAMKRDNTRSNEVRLEKLNIAVQMFKDDIKQCLKDKIIEVSNDASGKSYPQTYFFYFFNGPMPEDIEDENRQYYRSYNNMKIFNIINDFNKHNKDKNFMICLNNEINQSEFLIQDDFEFELEDGEMLKVAYKKFFDRYTSVNRVQFYYEIVTKKD